MKEFSFREMVPLGLKTKWCSVREIGDNGIYMSEAWHSLSAREVVQRLNADARAHEVMKWAKAGG